MRSILLIVPHFSVGAGAAFLAGERLVALRSQICESHCISRRGKGTGGAQVAVGLILEFEGVTDQEYDAVNDELGIDMGTGRGDWPEGLLSHSAGLNEYGHLVVLEVWDTPEHQVRFMEERLGEALARGGITGPPSSVTWIELVSHHPVVVAPAKRAAKKAPAKRAVKKATVKKATAKRAVKKATAKRAVKKATARRA